MTRLRTALAGAALLALAACPIPQPLPDYPPGEPVTPPRIVVDDTVRVISPSSTIVRIPAWCAIKPTFSLEATLRHELTTDPVSARWFVDYDPTSQDRSHFVWNAEIPPTDTGDPRLRVVPPYSFSPYDFLPVAATGGGSAAAPGAVHVVELVVSNGFDPAYDVPPPAVDLPYRRPKLNFEVQLYRWVFVTVTEDAASCTGSTCVRCPQPP